MALTDIRLGTRAVSAASLLVGLNPAQLKGVLTSRIAYMILQHSINPSSICAVTFTNKAANEMKERLRKLIGKGRTDLLKMGTFHALCARFLRIHATLVGLDTNFTICDADESKKIIATLIKNNKDYIEEHGLVLTDGGVASMISKAKAKGRKTIDVSADDDAKPKSSGPPTDKNDILGALKYIVDVIYEEYEKTLRRNNSLDFDDLLLYGVKLFVNHKHTVAWCKHVLVDEFQDTNTMQYDLMLALATHKRITVVGDPDQSSKLLVSGLALLPFKLILDQSLWLAICRGRKPRQNVQTGTQQIFLEQNYRSTASILRTSLAIVAQDKTRIQKSLHTTHPAGSTPFLHPFPQEHAEAQFIALEIKRLVAHMGGVLQWGDFAILLRFNALSRLIESALQREGIPSRVLGGHKFFERQEIKNVLAYLQLVDNPDFNPALVRAANVPSRGIGEKTLQEIASRAEKSGVSQLSIMEGICESRLPDLKPSVKRRLAPFIKVIRALREHANKGMSSANLIRQLVDLVEFEAHLRKTQPDWESRWENVKELITFASEVEKNINFNVVEGEDEATTFGETDSTLTDTPLRQFLQASMLSSEGDNQSEEENKEKVTISTCHAAKGLEWPVVIVPSTEEGTFPFARSEDIEEERRLLYVACTRAQGLLYLSHAERRTIAGNAKERDVSPFVSAVVEEDPSLFTGEQPSFRPSERKVLCDLLRRPLPDEAEIARRVAEFERTTQRFKEDYYHRPDPSFNSHSTKGSNNIPVEISTGFTSSSAMLRNTVSATASNTPNYQVRNVTGTSQVGGRVTGGVIHPSSSSSSMHSTHQPTKSGPPAFTGVGQRLGNGRAAASHPRPASRAETGPSQGPIRHVVTEARFVQPSQPLFHGNAAHTPTMYRPPRRQAQTQQTMRMQHVVSAPQSMQQQLHPLLRHPDSTHTHTNTTPQRSENIPPHPSCPPASVIPQAPPTALISAYSTSGGGVGVKRRLGMGRGGGGYSNKKFKPPA
ncbi:hypothetical protein DXG03_001761 [Asterophora parasitica]|uniref:DNA 3'-5' helicase n=1 Tax=Asterophora parasitica TaxID=117018 RepID=A0A9P7G6G5_9AGAR|nr:hypothetical protein DXG03_001761 [Asterophora parasitica]